MIGLISIISAIVEFFDYILIIIGHCALFHKDKIKRIWAFIPGAQQYFLAVMAEREEDGKTYCILAICKIMSRMIQRRFENNAMLFSAWEVISFALLLGQLLFSIRIFLSLCRIFNKRKRWTFLWLLFPGLTSVIWGFSKNFVPDHNVVSDTDYEKAAKISGATVEAIQNGLTVNITDRTITTLGKKQYLLKDIHMSIPVGHLVLLLGGSGAGKTTLLNAITGYEQANAQIILGGRNLYNNYESMKYSLGFVPQQDLMRLNDTVYRTLQDSASLRIPKSVHKKERTELIDSVMEKLGLSSVKNSQVVKLSGGQRKRLSIALELISDPMLFILDEPDSGLDGVVARNLFETLRKIADEGKIVIVITHTPDRVIDMFDDVIVLAKDATRTGRLAYYGPVKEAYSFFDKTSMEEILLSINQKDEGGEGRADEFVEKYGENISQ